MIVFCPACGLAKAAAATLCRPCYRLAIRAGKRNTKALREWAKRMKENQPMPEIRQDEHLETDLRAADRLARQTAELLATHPLNEQAIVAEILVEVQRSRRHGAVFASLHEAYAVILEELDEVWDITRQKRRDRSAADLQKELIQIGAMAVKALESMENFVGGTV